MNLLDRSLDEIRNDKPRGGRVRRGAAQLSNSRSRTSSGPYDREAAVDNVEGSWKHDLYNTSVTQPSRGAFAAKDESEASTPKLQISNLHYEVSERELESLFSQVGPLELPPSIRFDRSGRSEGRGTVTYKDPQHAKDAKRYFDGANAKGQPISVNFDFSYRRTTAPELLARVEGGKDLFQPKGRSNSGAFGSGAFGRRPERTESLAATYTEAPRSRSIRGSGEGRGRARGRGRGGSRGGDNRSTAKSAEDLDRELAAFMGDEETNVGKETVNEVEMAV